MAVIFKEVRVWRRIDEQSAVRYSCLEELTTGMFAVQSADFFHLPIQEEQLRYFEKQFLELFIDIAVNERCSLFSSLEEAIAAHDQEFS